jgi:hypothetical protein
MNYKVIKINVLDQKSIDDALEQIEEYKKRLSDKTEEFLHRMQSEGIDIASMKFMNADYAGMNDSLVIGEDEDKDNVAVVATGSCVLFIEFGTGLLAGQHPENQGFYPGSYGKHQGSNPKGWTYTGSTGTSPDGTYWVKAGTVHTYGNAPNMCMYDTVKELKTHIQDIATEVFDG